LIGWRWLERRVRKEGEGGLLSVFHGKKRVGEVRRGDFIDYSFRGMSEKCKIDLIKRNINTVNSENS